MFMFTIKNMTRYKLRNALTLFTISFSAIIIVFILVWVSSLMDLMIEGFINYQTGHIKITTEEFYENRRFSPLYAYIPNVSELAAEIRENKEVKTVMPIYNFGGLIGQKDNDTIQVRAVAIDFTNNTYGLDKKIVFGSSDKGGILMSEKLYKKSGFDQEDKILFVSPTVDGGLNGIKLPVEGLYNFKMKLFDSSTILINLKDAQTLLHSGDSTTELVILLNDENKTDEFSEKLSKKYPNLKIETYKEQLGPLYLFNVVIFKKIFGLFTVLIMGLGSLVIANSLIASIYDRINEIGMLKAIGFLDGELSLMLFYEGLIFGLVGGLIGCGIGFYITSLFTTRGIDLSIMIGDMPIDSIIYTKIDLSSVVISVCVAVLVPALVTIIPMRHIRRITPVEALKG